MPDEMFFSSDMRSLRRGKRVTARTSTCRPCLVWPKDLPAQRYEGVVMNMNAYGMLIRMLEQLPKGTDVMIQLMRDDDLQEPLAAPIEGTVARSSPQTGPFADHGIKLVQQTIRRAESRPVHLPQRRPMPIHRPRMHTIDITVGDMGARRTER